MGGLPLICFIRDTQLYFLCYRHLQRALTNLLRGWVAVQR